MYQSIDGIDISDYTYDKVCLNCVYWIQSAFANGGMVCGCGNGSTDPDDSCPSFLSLTSMDGDYNSYLAKSEKMEYWRIG